MDKVEPDFKAKVSELQEILCQKPEFWKRVDLIEKLLAPLTDAILKIEGAIVNVRDSYKLVDNAFQQSSKISEQLEGKQAQECKKVNFQLID